MSLSVFKKTSLQAESNHLILGLMLSALIVWFILLALGLAAYSGSKAAYGLFSIVIGIMLITGLRQSTSYGYLFLVIFLWLGFWLKLTIHVILNYSFVEPVGSFIGGTEAWNEVVYVATAASLDVMLGKLIYTQIKPRINALRGEVPSTVPLWYAKNRKYLWIGLMIAGITVLLINMKYGVHQIGLAPRIILIWPLNAVIAWLLNIGLATGIAQFLWWDIALKKNVTSPIVAIIAEAFLSSVSILSRATYVFHAIPQLWAVIRFEHMLTGWSRRRTVLLAVIFAMFFVVSISAVTTFRNYLYQSGAYSSTANQVAYARWEVLKGASDALRHEIENSPAAERVAKLERLRAMQAEMSKQEAILAEEKGKLHDAMNSASAQSSVLLNEFGYQITDGFSTRILQLSVDRWIGLEGLMAVQSYPEKNMSLLWHALSEKPDAGKPDAYQAISNSIYLKSDGTKFRFGTLPGAVAFLYYSSSLFIVMLGMVFFSLAVLVFEFFINALTANPIICSLYGAAMASNVVQFGGAPRQSLPYFLMLMCGILLVWMVRTSIFSLLLRKLKLFNTAVLRGH
jgi:hypothetical protein